jgi:hypothetical protein
MLKWLWKAVLYVWHLNRNSVVITIKLKTMSNINENTNTMKTFKNTTIIVAGIIVALISLSAHAAEKTDGNKSVEEKQIILEEMGIDKDLEFRLIEEYLEEQIVIEIMPAVNKAMIFDANDQLVFAGDPNSEKAAQLKISADFLMEYDNVSYYRLHK